MPATRFQKHSPYRPEDILSMVAGVEAYPEFIPLMTSMRVGKTREISQNIKEFEAEALISYKFLRESFRSKVRVDKEKLTVSVTKPGNAGAVRSLTNHWKLYRLSDGSTLIDFDVDVRLKAYPLEVIVRQKFERASEIIMGWFEARADDLFDPVTGKTPDLQAEYERLGIKPPQSV